MASASMRLGLIVNARSRRNQRLLPALREAVGPRKGIFTAELNGIDGLEEALRGFAARDVTLIGVVGGDGTVQAVLTRLFSGDGCGFQQLPTLTVLAGGTTNMTAADVGLRERPDRALRRLVSMQRNAEDRLPGTVLDRNVIELRRGEESPLYGMFFGTGAICRAIQLAHRSVHPMRLGSSIESALTIAGVFGQGLFGHKAVRDPVVRGDDISVTREGEATVRAVTLLAFSTTLRRLVLGSRPFWGTGPGNLRCTRIAYPAPRFWRSAPSILYGGDRRKLPPAHYSSCNVDRVRIEMDCPFTLDGEIFEASRLVPIELSGDRQISFFRF